MRAQNTDFRTAGKQKDIVDVEISYKIIQLFSEGLYSSPNKAIEELVSNSFDAGATSVRVAISPDRSAADAYIAVIDDGCSMNIEGLKQHWQIGSSEKRKGNGLKNKRRQIGKFGIGKLATYVLASELTHFCKIENKFYALTMDYTRISSSTSESGIFSKDPVQLAVRELTETEIREALAGVLPDSYLESSTGPALFGKKSAKSWTVALMTKPKEMATQVTDGRLRWVLSTAMPIGDDFKLFLNDERIVPAKEDITISETWIIGKDIIPPVSSPAPDGLEVSTDKKLKDDDRAKFGLSHPDFGRMYGKVELYEDLLTTGKEQFQRSNGFFIYVHGRLVNLEDPYFGIDSNLLKHGTFSRFRAEIHIDSLDSMIQSSREGVRENAKYQLIKETLRGIFNFVRSKYEESIERAAIEGAVSSRVGDSPRSLSNRPLAFIAEKIVNNEIESKYISVPHFESKDDEKAFLQSLTEGDGPEASIVKHVRLDELGVLKPMAFLELETRTLTLNTLHPFVAYHLDESPDATKSIELIGMVEILTEAYLAQEGVTPSIIDNVMRKRDNILRSLARSRGPQPAIIVARELLEAKTNQKKLEFQLNESFRSIGLEVTHGSGPGKPDGTAEATLSGDSTGKRSYRVALEAKSKVDGVSSLSAKELGAAGIMRHLTEFECDHSLVAAPDFDTTRDGHESATAKEIKTALGTSNKTITLVRIDDLANLVKGAPRIRLSPARLKELFVTCVLPDESAAWINKVLAEKIEEMPVQDILEVTWELAKMRPGETVHVAQVSTALELSRNIKIPKDQLAIMFRAIMGTSPRFIGINTNNEVEMNQKPEKILPTARQVFSLTPKAKQ